ncbi:hypothetical protein CDAR_414791 [Caerostris darwini]|uniref:Uncharacterized protein n=1 Tax=Caerostris darwini TaxID=1538125 RepID=A0AAV4RCI9_9ARAC|nr:hypothetical protein CDAR_414791 [Caerostris darwini]
MLNFISAKFHPSLFGNVNFRFTSLTYSITTTTICSKIPEHPNNKCTVTIPIDGFEQSRRTDSMTQSPFPASGISNLNDSLGGRYPPPLNILVSP